MKTVRNILGSFWFIHIMVIMGFAALLGYYVGNRFLIFFVVLSFAGATCGSFIKVIDTIKGVNQ